MVRGQTPPPEIELTLTFSNYITRGYSGLDRPVAPYDGFLSLLDYADLGLLHEIEAITTATHNFDLTNVPSAKIREKNSLDITNKLCRLLENCDYDREIPLEVKTSFDDVMLVNEVKHKNDKKTGRRLLP